ncbi:MAG: hypothetical protein JEZ02_14225 [Desulfatibacillum sp.]|nr:hypothetical protein [Desulfatibacillum sp.]
MIDPTLVISIARGLIKLGTRADRLFAEKAAVTSGLILSLPEQSLGPTTIQMRNEILTYLNDEEVSASPLIKPHEDEIRSLLAQTDPPPRYSHVMKWYRMIYPEQAIVAYINPDIEYAKALQTAFPGLDVRDKGTCQAVFAIGPGQNDPGINYYGKLALLVVDVLAEFGAENTSLFVRDEGVRSVVQAVLSKFSKPDLDTFNQWSPLLRHAISATLNGALDAREAYQGNDEWVQALLGALAKARTISGDDYILGLFMGKGYPLLLNEVMSAAGKTLNSSDASQFELIAAEVLIKAGELSKNDASFRNFFEDHWGDLLRAGLASLSKHGPAMLEGESPLLKQSLLAIVTELSTTTNAHFLSQDLVYKIADAAIGAIAKDSSLLDDSVSEPWLKQLLSSLVSTAADAGIRSSFSKQGLETILTNMAATMAEHPELIIAQPGLAQEVVKGVLEAVSESGGCFNAEKIAGAAIAGALEAIAANPALVDTQYKDIVKAAASRLAVLAKTGKISGGQASQIMESIMKSVLLNPAIYTMAQNTLASAVMEKVIRIAGTDPHRLLAGGALVSVVGDVLEVVSAQGLSLMQDGSTSSVDKLLDRTAKVLTQGLALAGKQLGKTMNISAMPQIIAGLLADLASGRLTDDAVSADDEIFIALFLSLAQSA